MSREKKCQKIANEILDDFESRTCENCFHSYTEKDELYCLKKVSDKVNYKYGESIVSDDFGCNRWKSINA